MEEVHLNVLHCNANISLLSIMFDLKLQEVVSILTSFNSQQDAFTMAD